MGCARSAPVKAGLPRQPKSWKHPLPLTKAQLSELRDEFWDTAPLYGGKKEIWNALRAATESEPAFAQAIIESAGINVLSEGGNLPIIYDEKGEKYELPNYVLSEPTNLIPEPDG